MKKPNLKKTSILKSGKGLSKSHTVLKQGSKLKTNTQLKRSPMAVKGSEKLNKTTKLKSRPKTKEQIELAKNEQELMWKVMLEIWEDRGPVSEVSGKYLGAECLTIYMHHIYPKSKYPQWKYFKPNIIVITPEEHSNVESNMYKYEEVNKRRLELSKLFI